MRFLARIEKLAASSWPGLKWLWGVIIFAALVGEVVNFLYSDVKPEVVQRVQQFWMWIGACAVILLVWTFGAWKASRSRKLEQPALMPTLSLTRYPERRAGERIESEAELLAAHARSITLVGRKEEMDELTAWLGETDPVSIRVLVGRAGAGKTRLALELSERAVQREWDAGFVPHGALEDFLSQPGHGAWRPERPTLAVVDYAAAPGAGAGGRVVWLAG